MRRSLVCLCLSMLPLTGLLFAQPESVSGNKSVPRLVRFSGSAHDPGGDSINNLVGITFSLYKEQEGGQPLWHEIQNVQLDTNGVYTVLLGATEPAGLPAELFTANEARWLGVEVTGQAEQPRVLLLTVPYALKAGDADTLGGKPVSAFVLNESPAMNTGGAASTIVMPAAPGLAPEATAANSEVAHATCTAITADGTAGANQVAKFTGPCTAHQSVISDNGTTVGIGGVLQLPATGTATSTLGFNSQPFDLLASSFEISTKAAVSQHFRWQAEPVGNDTATPSGKLNLLFGSGTGSPAETGLSISNTGLINFAAGQTLPSGITGQTANFTGNNLTQIVDVTQNGKGIAVSGTSTNGVGVSGSSSTTTNGIGVEGFGATGVSGTGLTNVAGSEGVFGSSLSVGGKGVSGVGGGTGGTGVIGLGTTGVSGTGFSTINGSIGVAGSTAASGGTGVSGAASGGNGAGVIGQATGSATIGVNGVGPATGVGVFGSSGGAFPFPPKGIGVVGESVPANGIGVSGVALGTNGVGVNGGSTSGTGVAGLSGSVTGIFGTSVKSSKTEGALGGCCAVGVWGDTARMPAVRRVWWALRTTLRHCFCRTTAPLTSRPTSTTSKTRPTTSRS